VFENKICVVTGGALGIGRCLTREFAKAGAKVAFIDKNEQAGKENEEFLKKNGNCFLFMNGDISNEQILQQFVDLVIKEFGKIDYLINNACINLGGIHTPCSYEDFNLALKIGVTAPFMLAQLFLPYFNVGASILNISSTRAFMSQANRESYAAAKGGITALTHSLAVSLSGRVRVNSIAPGWIDTGKYHDESYVPQYTEADIAQHPSNRVGEPMDIARAAMFLCDERNSFINGENITIDGGISKLMIYSGDHGWEFHPEVPIC
jgi:NAD(P)-dependent dehydrogenase (short-subunit alcohol dehydrogenase family)